MNRRSVNWNGLTDRQVIKLVGNVRTKQNGGDIFRALESPHMAMVKDSQLFFLQFNITVPDQSTGKLDRIIGYGNPSLFGILNGNVQMFSLPIFIVIHYSVFPPSLPNISTL